MPVSQKNIEQDSPLDTQLIVFRVCNKCKQLLTRAAFGRRSGGYLKKSCRSCLAAEKHRELSESPGPAAIDPSIPDHCDGCAESE